MTGICWTYFLKGIPIGLVHSTTEIHIDIHKSNKHESDEIKISRSGMSSPKLLFLRIYM
jgi:hypothetical protein